MLDFDSDETWRLKDTIYKTSAEAQAAIDQMNREYWALSYEDRLDCKIPTVIGHTEIVRDLLKAQEEDVEWCVMTLIKNGYHLPNKGISGVMIWHTKEEAEAFADRVNALGKDVAFKPYVREKQS